MARTNKNKINRVVKPKLNQTTIKPFTFRSGDSRYLGEEPCWDNQPDINERTSCLVKSFAWYNYYFDKKEAKPMLLTWLEHTDRKPDANVLKKVSEIEYPLTICWLSRMNLMGLQLLPCEESKILESVVKLKCALNKEHIDPEIENESKNRQETIQSRVNDCINEIDELFDTFVKNGMKMSADIQPIQILRLSNIPVQYVDTIIDKWTKEHTEFTLASKDPEIGEYYGLYTKTQIKNLIKFSQLVINACNSYKQIKKVERKPRARKQISPERLALKFKYLKEYTLLSIKSEPPSKLVSATEAWLFDTSKRKLIHVVADSHAGSLTIKGSSIVGFSEIESIQKTVRKPEELLKSFMKESKPNMRKVFKSIKSTETKWCGRSNEHLVILKAW